MSHTLCGEHGIGLLALYVGASVAPPLPSWRRSAADSHDYEWKSASPMIGACGASEPSTFKTSALLGCGSTAWKRRHVWLPSVWHDRYQEWLGGRRSCPAPRAAVLGLATAQQQASTGPHLPCTQYRKQVSPNFRTWRLSAGDVSLAYSLGFQC